MIAIAILVVLALVAFEVVATALITSHLGDRIWPLGPTYTLVEWEAVVAAATPARH